MKSDQQCPQGKALTVLTMKLGHYPDILTGAGALVSALGGPVEIGQLGGDSLSRKNWKKRTSTILPRKLRQEQEEEEQAIVC